MASLAKTILFGSDQDVQDLLATGNHSINELDEYGYTPLIETAIMDSTSKTSLLLEAGADVQFTDITGRSALHWAVDNNSLGMTRLLLKNNANPNAYMRAGQPVLVMPYLRQQEDLKQLLYRYGADLGFAQDFIHAKWIGHRYELEGRVDLVDSTGLFFETELEGFFIEFSLAMLSRSLTEFKNNYGGKHLYPYFPLLARIIQAYENGLALLRYQHHLINIKRYETKINDLLQFHPLLLPIAYDGHAITLIRTGHQLIRCDRGAYGRNNGTVIFYRMRNPERFNLNFMKFLLYKRQNREFIEGDLVEYLGLQPMMKLPISPQITGNCSWANMEAALPAMLFLLLFNNAKRNQLVQIEQHQNEALNFYKEWLIWDKDRALHFSLDTFSSIDKRRQAARATLFAAILFQQCQYGKIKDFENSEKLLRILTKPEFKYILKAYVDIFFDEPNHPQLKNLRALLDDYGIDIVHD